MPNAKTVTTAPTGRMFIVVGPHCWGRANTKEQALKNCQKEYGVKRLRQYIVFDAHEDTRIDDMGSFCYYPDKIPAGQTPYTELERVNR